MQNLVKNNHAVNGFERLIYFLEANKAEITSNCHVITAERLRYPSDAVGQNLIEKAQSSPSYWSTN